MKPGVQAAWEKGALCIHETLLQRDEDRNHWPIGFHNSASKGATEAVSSNFICVMISSDAPSCPSLGMMCLHHSLGDSLVLGSGGPRGLSFLLKATTWVVLKPGRWHVNPTCKVSLSQHEITRSQCRCAPWPSTFEIASLELQRHRFVACESWWWASILQASWGTKKH